MSASQDIVKQAKSNATNAMLLKYARLSPEEIEAKTGIDGREAMSRLADILRSRDWMSDRMEERLLLIELADLITSVRERMEGAGEEHFADIANVALRGYEAISKRLDSRRKLTEDDMHAISQAQGEMMMEAIRITLDMAVERMGEIHPELELEDDLRASFSAALPEAYKMVKNSVRE